MLRRAALTLACLFPAIVSAQTLPPGPKVTIAASTQPSPGVIQYSRVDVPILRDGVAQRSGGRIEVQLTAWPERSLTGPDVIRAVRAGQLDIGGVALSTVSGDVPLLDGFDLVGMNPTLDIARKVTDALLPIANRDLERFGVRIMGTMPFSAQVFFCRRPVTGFDDLKGRKIRGFGPAANEFINAVGGQAVAIGFPEVYGALERGVVDCAITGSGSGNGARWYEVSSTLYTVPLAWSVAGYFVNLRWWNGLDPAVRTFMEETFKELDAAQWKIGQASTQDGIDCNTGNRAGCVLGTFVERNPMTEVKPQSGDAALVRTTFETTVLASWVKRCGARCADVYNETIAPITGVRYVAK